MEDAKKLKSIGSYTLYDVIGEGSFSIVRKAMICGSNDIYACKIIPKIRFKERNLAMRFQLEIRVMQTLHHPNIVQIYDIFRDKQFYYVIMEYIGGGTLFDYVIDNRGINENLTKHFIYQIFKTMEYIHGLGICHRDLKLENILLDENQTSIKISDFGLSRFLDRKGLARTPVGSPMYASPECLSGKPYDGKKSDIWSCGVILYTLLTGKLPWFGKTQSHIFSQIKSANYEMPSYISTDCKKLIRSILTIDVKKRPSDTQILNSEWFQNIDNSRPYLIKQMEPCKLLSLKNLDHFFQKDIKSQINSASLECLLLAVQSNEDNLSPKNATHSKNDEDSKVKNGNDSSKKVVLKKNIPLKKVPSTTIFDVDFDKALQSIFFEKVDSKCTLPTFRKRHHSKSQSKKCHHSHRQNSNHHGNTNDQNSALDNVFNISEPSISIDINIVSTTENNTISGLRSKSRCYSQTFIKFPNENQTTASDNFAEDINSIEYSIEDNNNIPEEKNKNTKIKSLNDIQIQGKSNIQIGSVKEKKSHKNKKKSHHKSKKVSKSTEIIRAQNC